MHTLTSSTYKYMWICQCRHTSIRQISRPGLLPASMKAGSFTISILWTATLVVHTTERQLVDKYNTLTAEPEGTGARPLASPHRLHIFDTVVNSVVIRELLCLPPLPNPKILDYIGK